MSEACPICRSSAGKDIVLCVSEEAARAHRELFGLSAEAYETPAGNSAACSAPSPARFIMDRIAHLTGPGCTPGTAQEVSLHVVVDWAALLALALWVQREPRAEELRGLLATAGMDPAEAAVTAAESDRGFGGLYRRNRLDILRKLCRQVKTRIEERMGVSSLSVDCHIFAPHAHRLLASSL